MNYTPPANVVSPKKNWRLVAVIIDRGEGECAYAIGMWDQLPRIGFRWNGTKKAPLGNPQSRGLPTWTMLDFELHDAVLALVKKESPNFYQKVQMFLSDLK